VPIWLTAEGIVAGNISGRLFNLSKNKLKMGIPARGASLYRNLDGVFQFLTGFKRGETASGAGFADAATIDAFENGRITQSNAFPEGPSSRAGFTDTATCRVFRGGVEI
jgi:hypothetical protein